MPRTPRMVFLVSVFKLLVEIPCGALALASTAGPFKKKEAISLRPFFSFSEIATEQVSVCVTEEFSKLMFCYFLFTFSFDTLDL